MVWVLMRVGITPADFVEFFQLAHEQIEHQADEADHHHAGDDEVVAFAGVARVNDEIAEAGVDGDHLGGHHDQPRDAERDANAGDDLRQGRRKNDAAEKAASG